MVRKDFGSGATYLAEYFAIPEQRALAEQCRALIDGDVPAYVPVVRGGGKMHVRMLCLGRHWNGRNYQYENRRTDFDGLAAPPIPVNLRQIAREIAAAADMSVDPDICILNYYDGEGRMGLHQDKDEGPRSLAEGWPVVSISIGDSARFLFGGVRRKDPVEPILLQSGDAFVFGGAARLRYHGVSRIVPHTAPPELAMSGRFNLTFRRSDAHGGPVSTQLGDPPG